MFKSFVFALICLFSIYLHGQTNEFYRANQISISATPVVFHTVPVKGGYTLGFDTEIQYTESKHTATSLEVGTTDFRKFQADNGINYYATKQHYLFIPFPTTKFFDRLQLDTYVGAEKRIDDGATGTSLGIAANFALTENTYLFADLSEHITTKVQDDGTMAKAGLKFAF